MTLHGMHEYPLLEEKYIEMTHPSGLTLLVCPKNMSATYATLGVKFGALDALNGDKTPAGVAHFLEHKMFERADGQDTDSLFAALGAEVNAFTTYERTAYQFSCTEHFSEALRALFDLVMTFSVTAASVRRERKIIAEEIRMSADHPYERCYTELIRALYHTHGVRREICGSEASIGKITPTVLKQHYDTYYRPDNMILSVCGNVTPEAVMTVVDECLDAWKGKDSPIPSPTVFDEPLAVKQPWTSRGMAVSQPLFCLGGKCPSVPADPRELLKLDITMTLLCEVLFSQSGALYNELFEQGMISPAWSYGASVGRGYAYAAVSGEADHPEEVIRLCRNYIEDQMQNGLSAEDLERSRRVMYADFVTDFDSAEDVAEALWGYAADGLSMFDYLTVLESITLEDVEALCRETFVDGQTAVSVVIPMETKGV